MITSIYFSDKLQNQIFPDYMETFRSDKVKRNLYSFTAAICNYCKKDFLDIRALQAQAFFNSLALPGQTGKKRAAPSTIQLKYASLRAFSNYLIQNASRFEIGYFTNPFDLVNISKPNPYLDAARVPTPAQMNDILHQCEAEPILYTALSLIIKCGLTVGELLRLRQDSFILDDAGQAGAVFTYRGSQRYIKIPNDLLAVLDYYWNRQTVNTEYLFENKAKQPMSVRDFERLYKNHMGSHFRFTLSDLRNGCIAQLLSAGVPAKEVGKYVGIRQYSWLHRYDRILPELSLAPCDYSNLCIKLPNTNLSETAYGSETLS